MADDVRDWVAQALAEDDPVVKRLDNIETEVHEIKIGVIGLVVLMAVYVLVVAAC